MSHFSNILGEVLVELTTVIKLEFLIIRDKDAPGSLVNYLNIELVELEYIDFTGVTCVTCLKFGWTLVFDATAHAPS